MHKGITDVSIVYLFIWVSCETGKAVIIKEYPQRINTRK